MENNEEETNKWIKYTTEDISVIRQISDWWEYDTEDIPTERLIPSKMGTTSSQNCDRNFLNKNKEEHFQERKTKVNVINHPQNNSGSPWNLIDNYLRAGKTMKTK